MSEYLFVISLSLLFFSCEKNSTDPVFSKIPTIKITEVSHDTLVQFIDQLVLKIEYEDGDGDLGNANPDVNSIFVKDSRLENPDEYYLPPLAPDSAMVSITGIFNLELSTTFLFGNGTEESAIFEVFVIDRAGNVSETVETTPILIIK
jgi:hypothetical protein